MALQKHTLTVERYASRALGRDPLASGRARAREREGESARCARFNYKCFLREETRTRLPTGTLGARVVDALPC